MKILSVIFLVTIVFQANALSPVKSWKELTPPEVNGNWVQPTQEKPAQPVWGHVNGIQVGLAPMPGPRGLLRIYTPYLGQPEGKMINFVALEPIPAGEEYRGLSELEMSELDGVRGKRFWSSDDSLQTNPLSEEFPARGVIRKINGVETLTVFIFSEPFKNGAKVYIRLRFFENRPYEIELSTYACRDSRKLKNFILTATMGNYARLRTVYLEGSTKSSVNLWPGYKETDFAPHIAYPLKKMIRNKNGYAYFIAAPNEKNPWEATYSPDTNQHWKYQGAIATQYWYSPKPDLSLEGLVNGRFAYWASKSPIPGGIAFENFELKEKFRNGATFIFGVCPGSPEDLINRIKSDKF
jgi:hypothetical protein